MLALHLLYLDKTHRYTPTIKSKLWEENNSFPLSLFNHCSYGREDYARCTLEEMGFFLEFVHLHSVEGNSSMVLCKVALEPLPLQGVLEIFFQVPVKIVNVLWHSPSVKVPKECSRSQSLFPLKCFDISTGDQSSHIELGGLSSHTCNAHVLRAGSLLTHSNKIFRHLTYKHSCKSHFARASFCTLNSHKHFISAKERKMSSLRVFKGRISCMQMLPSLSISGLKCKPTHVMHK